MNIGILYMVTAFVCLLQIVFIINRTMTTTYKESVDSYFVKMLYFFAIFCGVDFLWGMFSSKAFLLSQFWFMIVSYGFHSLAAISAFIWLGYILHFTTATELECKVLHMIRNVLFSVQLITIASNLFTHRAFSVSVMGDYYMGDLRQTLYVLQLTYFIVVAIFCIYKFITDRDNTILYRNAMLFSLLPLLFSIGQYMFYDAAMYSLGFMFTAFTIYSFNVTSQREEFLEEQFSSLDRQQSSIIGGLAGSFVSIYYVDLETGEFDIFRKSPEGAGIVKEETKGTNYFRSAVVNGERIIYHLDQDAFHEQFSREAILKELENKSMHTLTYRIVHKGIPLYFQYRFVRPISAEEPNKLIVGVYNVDSEVRAELQKQEEKQLALERELSLKKKTEKLSIDVYIDALSGLYNRRSYEDDILNYPDIPTEPDFTYFSFDLNGLKATNDNIGHDAGDELIKAAAYCMRTCLGSYGKLYRVGGDEFVAMIFASKEKLYDITQDFDETMALWSGKLVDELSLSYGYATKEEFPTLTVVEIAKIADKRMYEDKARYYAKRGIDRRGQQEAYQALCDSYAKILKVNLFADSYSIIRMDESEKASSYGFHEKISVWLQEFAKTGSVHPDDLDKYLRLTDFQHLRKYFANDGATLCFHYRRRVGNEFRNVQFELIRAKEYTQENQIVFLYVKIIEED